MKRLFAWGMSICLILHSPGSNLAFADHLQPLPVAQHSSSSLDLRGLSISLNNPLHLNFYIEDPHHHPMNAVTAESKDLIELFLTALTIPQQDWWVNLSPYEHDRIISNTIGQTSMGIGLLEQDFLLKRRTALLMHPDGALGKEFWRHVYEYAEKNYGTTAVSINTCHKVWIVPKDPQVLTHDNTVIIQNAPLKVMMEKDYLALKNRGFSNNDDSENTTRELILPVIEKEINEGSDFKRLRQIYQAMILSVWYRTHAPTIVNEVFTDQSLIQTMRLNQNRNRDIYEKYKAFYKKGAFNIVREEFDSANPHRAHKYFAGGLSMQFELSETKVNADVMMKALQSDWQIGMNFKPHYKKTDMAAVAQLMERFLVERSLRRWEWCGLMLRELSKDPSLAETIVPNIVIVFELLKSGVVKDLGNPQGEDMEDVIGGVRMDLDDVLQDGRISLNLRRQLYKAIPLVLTSKVESMLWAATDMQDIKSTPLTRHLRSLVHNYFLQGDTQALKAYLHYLKGDMQGEIQLKEMGVPVADQDHLENEEKMRMIAAVEHLIKQMDLVYGEPDTSLWESVLTRIFEKVQLTFNLKESCLNALTNHNFDQLFSNLVSIRVAWNHYLQEHPSIDHFEIDLKMEQIFQQVALRTLHPKPLPLLVENLKANGFDTKLVDLISDHYHIIDAQNESDPLKLYAWIKRLERMIQLQSQPLIEYQKYVPTIAAYGHVVQPFRLNNFVDRLIRGDSTFMLTQELAKLKQACRQKMDLQGWEIIVPGQMQGRLHWVDSIAEYEQGKVNENEVLVIRRIPLETVMDKPLRGIITLEDDGILPHAAINARQLGIPFFVCPDLGLLRPHFGKMVRIFSEGHQMKIQKGQFSMSPRKNLFLKEIHLEPHELDGPALVDPMNYRLSNVGPKAFHLAELDQILDHQAQHVTLTFAAFSEVLNSVSNSAIKNEIDAILESLEHNPRNPGVRVTKLKNLIKSLKIDPKTLNEWSQHIISSLGPGVLVFLRSSSNFEDLLTFAGAGLFHSEPAIDPANLPALKEGILKVWASLFSSRLLMESQRYGIKKNQLTMAILIQEMVPVTYSFVIHTQNPSTGNPDEMVLELIQGLGEALVDPSEEFSGSPHRFVWNVKTKQMRVEAYANKHFRKVLRNGKILNEWTDYARDEFFLNTEQSKRVIKRLFQQAVLIKSHSKFVDQDIEGGLVQRNTGLADVYFQTRPQQLKRDKALLAQKPLGGIDLTQIHLIELRTDGRRLNRIQNILIPKESIDGMSYSITTFEPFTRLE